VVVGGSLTVSGPVSIDGDKPLTAAPHMFFTGNLPGALFYGQPAAFVVPGKNILITRFSMWVDVPVLCSPPGTVSIESYITDTFLYNLTIAGVTTDSGPLSIPVAANTPLFVWVTTAPSCGINFPTKDGAVSIQYVMQ